MTHEDLQELLGAYAVDAVDDDERVLVEAHIAGCATCHAELGDLLSTLAGLTIDEPAPPASVWAGIEAAIRPPASPIAPVAEPPSMAAAAPTIDLAEVRRLRRRARVASVVSVAAVAVSLVMAASLLGRDDSAPTLREVAAAAVDSGATTLPVATESGDAIGRVALVGDGTAYLLLDAQPDADHVYQLWAVDQEVVSVGLVGTDGALAFRVEPGTRLLVVTEEPRGGSVVARGPAVGSAELSA